MLSPQNRSALSAVLSVWVRQTARGQRDKGDPSLQKVWTRALCSRMAIATLIVMTISACSSNPSSAPEADSGQGSEAIADANTVDPDPATELSDSELASGESVGDGANPGVALAQEDFEQLLPFSQEAERLNVLIRCAEGKLYPPAFEGDGSLYKCIAGENESLRIFLREDPETASVKNLKILWFGNRVPESDSSTGQILQTLASYYGGDRADEIEQTFWDSNNEELETNVLDIDYRLRTEISGVERLMVFSPKS